MKAESLLQRLLPSVAWPFRMTQSKLTAQRRAAPVVVGTAVEPASLDVMLIASAVAAAWLTVWVIVELADRKSVV